MADRLDAALHQLADAVVFPETPALESAVLRGLRKPSTVRPQRPWGRSLALALGLTLVVAATVAALTWLLPGLRITPVASVPPAPVLNLGDDLRLGMAIDAADAGFAIADAGAPDSTYASADGTVTSLVYAAGDELPEIDGTRIGLLVQRIEGSLEQAMVEKLVEEVGAVVTPVTVGDADGFWIEGPPHLVRYRTPAGAVRAEMTRLAGDTLVWQDGDVLYRMESALGMAAARALAATVIER